MDASAQLAEAEDCVIDEAVAILAQRDEARESPGPEERRRDVRQLFHLVLRCMRAGRAEPIIRPSERIAAHCYAAGIDLAEVQEAFDVVAEVLWRHLVGALAGEQVVQALGLLNAIIEEGKNAMARIYVALATGDRNGQDEQSPGDSAAAGTGSEGRASDVVLTGVVGQVGIITLEDRPHLSRSRRRHGAWHGMGGAVDLVLSCDLAVADETASFAITAANLGLPYNITGLLHFQWRLPINVIKEMFFTAAPIDARKAKEWLLINHLVPWDRLESFTLELAARMATKSPLAIAVIKEQLRVLSDYQPIAAQVYERVQGLRREAYESSDYLEGLNAFVQKRQPIFRGI